MVGETHGTATDLVAIDALGAGGEYRTRNREVITTTAGVPVAELSMVPPLYVSRTVSAQRKIVPLSIERRETGLADAAEAFTNAVIAGLDFDAYVELASQVSGVPITVTRAGARSVADSVASAFDATRPARPDGAVLDWREERTRGESLIRLPDAIRRNDAELHPRDGAEEPEAKASGPHHFCANGLLG